MANETFDAVIVGAGFAGIYQLKKLRNDLRLKCVCIDFASDVGGTWYWNRYPGAMSDSESYVYRFSWDVDDLHNYPWKDHYVKQPEVLDYLRHVTDKYDLRKDMRFQAEMTGANWDDEAKSWTVHINHSETWTARYIVTGLGLLSKTHFPDIPGLQSFQGDLHHTAKWPSDYSLQGKKVGIIGSGSTGVQVITEIGRKVGHLTSFQRHPQYSVPSGDRKVDPEYRKWVNANYDDIWARVRDSITAFGFEESKISYHDVGPEERKRIFQQAWDQGNGFRFMFGTFNDIAIDPESNEAAAQFIRDKISKIVKDPEKARKLTPHDVYARRPLCDGNAENGEKYFEQFNRPNVDIVDLRENPIVQIEPNGVRTKDDVLHEIEVLICATGFDAVEGNYNRMNIIGRNGLSLKDAWAEGPTSALGVHVPEFPNLFMITGPKGPFTNIIPAVEVQVEWTTELIQRAERAGAHIIEVTHEAEQRWRKLCDDLAAQSLFWKATDNWIFGANIPGKPRTLRFYFGGMGAYQKELRESRENGFPDFKPFQ